MEVYDSDMDMQLLASWHCITCITNYDAYPTVHRYCFHMCFSMLLTVGTATFDLGKGSQHWAKLLTSPQEILITFKDKVTATVHENQLPAEHHLFIKPKLYHTNHDKHVSQPSPPQVQSQMLWRPVGSSSLSEQLLDAQPSNRHFTYFTIHSSLCCGAAKLTPAPSALPSIGTEFLRPHSLIIALIDVPGATWSYSTSSSCQPIENRPSLCIIPDV